MNRGLLLAFMALGACSSGEPPQGVTGESGPRGGTTFRESTDTSRRGPSTERSAISLSGSGVATTSTTSDGSSTELSSPRTTSEATESQTTSTPTTTETRSGAFSSSFTTTAVTGSCAPQPAFLTVRGPTGQPITDAVFYLTGFDGGVAALAPGARGQAGVYVFGGNIVDGTEIQAGFYNLTVTAPGYASQLISHITVGLDQRGCSFEDAQPSRITVWLDALPPDGGLDSTVSSTTSTWVTTTTVGGHP